MGVVDLARDILLDLKVCTFAYHLGTIALATSTIQT